MNRRRAVVGLCMLCALLISAFAAQSALAASKGTTWFTCKDTGGGGSFTKAHCKPEDAGVGNFSHVAIAENTTTDLTITSEKTNAATNGTSSQTLKATIGGISFEMTTQTVNGTGGMTNKKDPETGEHYLHGHELILTFLGITVSSPAGKGCKIYRDNAGVKGEEGAIHTEKMTATSTGQGDFIKLEPENAEKVFARFFIEGCAGSAALEALNKTYSLTGSFKCKPDGATLNCDHAEITTQNTLKLNGSIKTGFTGKWTISGKDTPAGDLVCTPLSTTTVETA